MGPCVVNDYVNGNEKHQIRGRKFLKGEKAEMSYLQLGDVNTRVDYNTVYTFFIPKYFIIKLKR